MRGRTLGAGLIAGVFFAFSSFVMPALATLSAAQGIAAMQSINVSVLNRSFLGAFVGTAVLCLIVAVLSLSTGLLSTGLLSTGLLSTGLLSSGSMTGSKLRIAGSMAYVVGTFLVTMVCNVPLNERLASLSPDLIQAAGEWTTFVSSWTTWNTVRALAALAAATLLTLSLVQSAGR